MNEYRDYGISKIMDLAEQNDISAIIELARRYYHGTPSIEKDISKSEFWIKYAKDLVNSDRQKLSEIDNEVKSWEKESYPDTSKTTTTNLKDNNSKDTSSSSGLKAFGVLDLILIIPKVYYIEEKGYGEYTVPFVIVSIIIDLFLIFK